MPMWRSPEHSAAMPCIREEDGGVGGGPLGGPSQLRELDLFPSVFTSESDRCSQVTANLHGAWRHEHRTATCTGIPKTSQPGVPSTTRWSVPEPTVCHDGA